MRARQFKQSSGPSEAKLSYNDYVSEALTKQAANRPPKTPPKALEVTKPLPRVRKSSRRGRATGK
ncbi:MAG TPA: hypothetical protein VF669_19670 [Tepidisphaeraceae bacterium]